MKSKILNIINKKNKSKLVCLTAYSKNMSKLLDKYCDIILIGDSLGNVIYGMKNTHLVTMDMMTQHARSVMLGVKNSLCIVDMPKNSYKYNKQTLDNAKNILKETRCHGVKIESNYKNSSLIKHLVKFGINVMGHIGFTPQYKKKFKVEGNTKDSENKLIKEALAIEKAGAFAIVLECITSKTAKKITSKIKIPTIGIGSSLNCDGQILVTEDMLGLSGFYPKFVKKYGNLEKLIEKHVQEYKKDVITGKFPKGSNSY